MHKNQNLIVQISHNWPTFKIRMYRIIEYIAPIVRGAINGQYYCQLLEGSLSMVALPPPSASLAKKKSGRLSFHLRCRESPPPHHVSPRRPANPAPADGKLARRPLVLPRARPRNQRRVSRSPGLLRYTCVKKRMALKLPQTCAQHTTAAGAS